MLGVIPSHRSLFLSFSACQKSRSRVEELEDIAELVSGGDGLEGHLESAADLHRAVLLLWEGVSDVLGALAGASGRPGGTDCGDEAGPKSPATSASCEGVVASTNPAALALSDDPAARYALSAVADATDEISNDISSMLRDQELLDIPMHLEDLPVSAVTAALAVDADRVQAATKLLVPGILGALTAAATAAATATAAGQPDGDIALQAAPPEEAPPVAPAFPVPAVPPPPRSPMPDDLGVPPQSGRQRLSTSAGSGSLLSEGGEEETPPRDERALSKEDAGGAEEDSGIQGECALSMFEVFLVFPPPPARGSCLPLSCWPRFYWRQNKKQINLQSPRRDRRPLREMTPWKRKCRRPNIEKESPNLTSRTFKVGVEGMTRTMRETTRGSRRRWKRHGSGRGRWR